MRDKTGKFTLPLTLHEALILTPDHETSSCGEFSMYNATKHHPDGSPRCVRCALLLAIEDSDSQISEPYSLLAEVHFRWV